MNERALIGVLLGLGAVDRRGPGPGHGLTIWSRAIYRDDRLLAG